MCFNLRLRCRLTSSSRGAHLAKRHTASCLPLPRGSRAASASLVDLEGYLRGREGSPGPHSSRGEQVGGASVGYVGGWGGEGRVSGWVYDKYTSDPGSLQ